VVAVSVLVVGVVSSLAVGALLALLAYLFVHLARTTKRSLGGTMKWSRWLTGLGVAIAVAGIVIGVWLQLSVPRYTHTPGNYVAQQRLDYASIGIGMIGSGALLAVVAQIMGMMQATRQSLSAPDAGVTVAGLSEP